MKKLLITLLLSLSGIYTYAQSSAGLVAHWDMNGGVTDVSGNGHNGHATNVVATAGMSGVPNTAYKFNGLNSFITAPYMPDLNMATFSICSKLKIDGFWGGLCQGNYVIARGVEAGSPGNWSLRFDDNAFNNCYEFDSTKQVFISTAGTNAPSSATAWQYTPTLVKNKWYNVVVTYDGTTWRIYIDCTLINTIVGPGNPVGTSMDSLAIGMNIWHPSYPYPFNGAIDDIRVYNRVLHDSEIMMYCDTCGYILTQPTNVMASLGTSATFVIATSITAPSYQWQHDTGTGYYNLTNGGNYAGVYTPTLTVSGITSDMYNKNYRCLVSNESGCSQITDSAQLMSPNSITNTDYANSIYLYPNPSQSQVNIVIPHFTGEGKVLLTDELGRTAGTWQINNDKTNIDLTKMNAGIYIARIHVNGQVIIRKIVKI